MKNQFLSVLLCAAVCLYSCKKSSQEQVEEAIYVAGIDKDSITSNEQATVWKNENKFQKLNSPFNTFIADIYVSGKDVYATGYSNESVRKWKVWKNNTELHTFWDSDPTSGKAIYVVNDDVYAAGLITDMYSNPFKYFPVITKNGSTLYTLTDGNDLADITGLVVSGNDVYASGYQGNVAKLWKNGVEQPLSNATGYRTSALFIQGSDVYLTGTSNLSPIKIRFWKNGESTDIVTGPNDAISTSITAAGNDVYICGYEITSGKSIARLWKNGNQQPLADGTKNSYAYDVAVKDNTVYVAGSESNAVNSFSQFATLWKNGTPVVLGKNGSRATSIFIK